MGLIDLGNKFVKHVLLSNSFRKLDNSFVKQGYLIGFLPSTLFYLVNPPLSVIGLTLETLAIFCNVKPWGGMDSYPPINDAFGAVFGYFFKTILEIHINEEPMQKIGSPAFIFWSGGPLELSYLEPV